jgi:hypothetical protein
MTEQELMKRALSQWGSEAQVNMAFEEMAELAFALCKYRRGKVKYPVIVEEIVDVSLMIEQLRLIYDLDNQFEKIRKQKLLRLANILIGEAK